MNFFSTIHIFIRINSCSQQQNKLIDIIVLNVDKMVKNIFLSFHQTFFDNSQ